MATDNSDTPVPNITQNAVSGLDAEPLTPRPADEQPHALVLEGTDKPPADGDEGPERRVGRPENYVEPGTEAGRARAEKKRQATRKTSSSSKG